MKGTKAQPNSVFHVISSPNKSFSKELKPGSFVKPQLFLLGWAAPASRAHDSVCIQGVTAGQGHWSQGHPRGLQARKTRMPWTKPRTQIGMRSDVIGGKKIRWMLTVRKQWLLLGQRGRLRVQAETGGKRW